MPEQAGGGQEEDAPAPRPHRGSGAVNLLQYTVDGGAVAIEIRQPVHCGPRILRAVPVPVLLQPEQIAVFPDHRMARHDPAGEKMLGDPVSFILGFETVRRAPMAEHMQEQSAIRPHPTAHPAEQIAPVGHMFKHLHGHHPIKRRAGFKHIHVSGDNPQIAKATPRSFAFNISPLRLRI